MPLTLITGPANSAKAGEVLRRFVASLDQDPLLVVPRVDDVEHYQRELAARGAIFGGAVTTFGGLMRTIVDRLDEGSRPPAPLGPLGRERLLARVISDAQLESLDEAAGSPGFRRALLTLIAELQRALVDPPQLKRALASWARGAPDRRRYATDLCGLWDAYRRALAAIGRRDDELHGSATVAALAAAPETWGQRPVLLYGF
ncbi:MAG TPA: hypothetical protein VHE14_00420, partial [Solirubrobacteraceae bacterium]|nr:hypothetical protein [Solirubrobacteraceae bacterium]